MSIYLALMLKCLNCVCTIMFHLGSSCMEASSEEETSGVHKAGRLQHPEGSISQICSFQKVNNCKDSLTGIDYLK